MSAVDIPAEAARPRRSLRELEFLDWVFVFFSWLTAAWLLFNVLELLNRNRALPFDIMPFAAGVLVVTFGWWALRLGKRVDLAVDGLDQGASLERKGDIGIDEFQKLFRARVKRWSIGFGIFITVFMGGGFAASLLQKHQRHPFFDGLLGSVMIVAGYVIGSLLGRLIGYAFLLSAMEKRGIRIFSLATLEATTALRGLEGVYLYAVVSATVLCHWSAFWWITWELGFDPGGYRNPWEVLTLGIWAIAFVLFIVTGWIPIRAFQNRLDGIYGGVDARRAIDQQLKEAQEDRRKLVAALDGRSTSTEILELDRFIDGIQERRFRSPFLSPGVLLGLTLWIALLFVLPLVWSLATTGEVLNRPRAGVRIDAVVPDGAAAAAGFSAGDIVAEIDGGPIRDSMTMKQIIARSAGRELTFKVERGRDRIELRATPRHDGPAASGGGPVGVLGLTMSNNDR